MLGELGHDADACIAAAVAKTEHEMRPVPFAAAARAEWDAAIDERLRRLAVKVLPTAPPAQTAEWRVTMIEALSDLPALIALTAAKRAIHQPFRFIGEIETAIRAIAVDLIEQRTMRLRSLERMRNDIERARRAPTMLPQADIVELITDEQRQQANAFLRRCGIRMQFAADGTTFDAPQHPDEPDQQLARR